MNKTNSDLTKRARLYNNPNPVAYRHYLILRRVGFSATSRICLTERDAKQEYRLVYTK